MIEIILKDSEWLRGDDGDSFLLREDGKRCCIGIAAKHFGVTADLMGVETLANLVDLDLDSIPSELQFLIDYIIRCNSRVAGALMQINDKEYRNTSEALVIEDDKHRVAELNKHAEPHGIRFVFVDDSKERL